ncbi:Transcriptional regulator [Escherichia coli]|nr:regulator with homeodomain-like DNA binding domain [Escherichia coli]CAD5504685.1 regulator with homeodomain-like DNA binding domain [Escherichia coli]
MLHTANPVIKHKAGLLNLAEELSNVSKACKIMGVCVIRFIVTANWSLKAVWMRRLIVVAALLTLRTVPMRQLNRLLLITPSLSRHMVSTGPATSCVNRGFLSPTVVSVLSGYSITLRISKDDTEQILSGDVP